MAYDKEFFDGRTDKNLQSIADMTGQMLFGGMVKPGEEAIQALSDIESIERELNRRKRVDANSKERVR